MASGENEVSVKPCRECAKLEIGNDKLETRIAALSALCQQQREALVSLVAYDAGDWLWAWLNKEECFDNARVAIAAYNRLFPKRGSND